MSIISFIREDVLFNLGFAIEVYINCNHELLLNK